MILLVENFFYGVEKQLYDSLFFIYTSTLAAARYYYPLALYSIFRLKKWVSARTHMYNRAWRCGGWVWKWKESCAAAMCEISHSTREISIRTRGRQITPQEGRGNWILLDGKLKLYFAIIYSKRFFPVLSFPYLQLSFKLLFILIVTEYEFFVFKTTFKQ